MKISVRLRLCLACAALGALLTGCWKSRLAWSPDGTRAAIVTTEGLHLADAEGNLTPLVVPGVTLAAWLDNRQLVLARAQPLRTLAELRATLGAERMQRLAAKAEFVWQQLEAGTPSDKIAIKPDDDALAVLLYLREQRPDALKARLAKDWDDLEKSAAVWHSIVLARVDGDRVELGATLHEGLGTIAALRPAPTGSAVAFTTRPDVPLHNDDAWQLHVVAAAGGKSALVAASTAIEPDWTPDGRALVYLASGTTPVVNDDLRLGTLVERRVIDDAGRVALDRETRELAGLIFQDANRVRCLPDGRVLFDAAEFQLPATPEKESRDRFFILDRTAAKPALRPLDVKDEVDKPVAFFSVSPDGAQVLIGGDKGSVWLVTLASGEAHRIATQVADSDKTFPLPAWRAAGEFVYLRRKAAGAGTELVLRRGSEERVLSARWPEAVLEKLVD